jgi:serine/threonine protein kinase
MHQPPSRQSWDGSLQILWNDGDRVFCREWREAGGGDWKSVVVVFPAAERPSPDVIARLGHEHGLKNHLDSSWALRPIELVHKGDRTVLVLEDPGGEPLAPSIGPPLETGRFLRLAIAISTAVAQLHESGLIHKDIKPSNIFVDSGTNKIWLTGFGVASRVLRERQSPAPPEIIAGTFAYMAPEQTGRMNRSIDTRSDLYALGVTLYQMLTGALPFTASDPMEWVYCHIARRPTPPGERMQNIPTPVSAIIVKLLAKTPEERYQTAGGVERDLRRCVAEWDAQRCIDDFPLGLHDIPSRLLIPEKLYGREAETATLLACFDRIIHGSAPELVLVSG